MAENDVSIRIDTDLSQVQQDSAKLAGSLKNAATGATQGFDQANQRVVALRQQIETLKRALQQSSDPRTVKRLSDGLALAETRMRSLTAATQTNRRAMAGAGAATGNLRAIQAEAATKAVLLGQQLGVVMPTAIQRLVTSTEGLRTVLNLAFGVGAVVFFGAAIVRLFPKIIELKDKVLGLTEEVKNLRDAAASFNEEFLKLSGGGAFERHFAFLKSRAEELRKEIETLDKATVAIGGPVGEAILFVGNRAIARGKLLREELERVDAAIERMDPIINKAPLDKLAEDQKKAAAAAAAHKKQIEEAARAAEAWEQAQGKLREELSRTGGAVVAAQRFYQGIIDTEHEAADAAKRETAIRQAGLGDAQAAAGDYIKTVQDTVAAELERGRAAQQAADKQIAEYERVTSAVEGFINRTFLTARSVADVFHQFLTQLLGSFVKWVSRMIAASVLGIRQSASGGIAGQIFGGIFGGGGGLGAGLTSTAAVGGLGVLPGAGGITGLPASIGATTGVSGAAGAIPGAAGGATSAFSGLGALLPLGLGVGGLGLISGAFGTGSSPGRGALLGGLGGGLIGAGIGAGFLGSLGLGALAFGPVGAVIGGVVGLIAGIFGRGKAKRQAAAIEESTIAQADTAVTLYKRFKQDFETTLAALDTLRQLAAEQTRSLGKPGRNALNAISSDISDKKREVDAIEQERQRRAFVLAGASIPEFAVGGPMPGHGSGGMLAVLHPDEWVLTKGQRQWLGDTFLRSLPKFAAGGPVDSRPGGHDARGRRGDVIIRELKIIQQGGESPQLFANRVVRTMKQAIANGEF